MSLVILEDTTVLNTKYIVSMHIKFNAKDRDYTVVVNTVNSQHRFSCDSIKKAIVELVDDEDKEHPLSDNQILKKLEELELHCSRRVIVKYRQQLNIPSSTKRKVLKKVG